jgi:hypothetical protein
LSLSPALHRRRRLLLFIFLVFHGSRKRRKIIIDCISIHRPISGKKKNKLEIKNFYFSSLVVVEFALCDVLLSLSHSMYVCSPACSG